MNGLVEFMSSDATERYAYRNGSKEFTEQLNTLKARFNIVGEDTWFSISTPQYNPIHDDFVVSVVFQAKPAYLSHIDTAAIGRKYFLNKGWVYDKIYTFLHPNQNTLPCPDGATPMFDGKLINVFGQPGNKDLTRYVCLYFMHKDHAAVEAWSGQQLSQGKYSTFYASTFDTEDDNKLLRMKTYCYDEQGGFSDWDVIYMQHCKRHNVFDQLVLP